MTPTQRSLKHLREAGYFCWIVEHWDHFARKRRDLWGFVDILALKENEVLAVQATSTGVAARVKKITEHENLAAVRKAGVRINVFGWRKNAKGRYVLRVVDLS